MPLESKKKTCRQYLEQLKIFRRREKILFHVFRWLFIKSDGSAFSYVQSRICGFPLLCLTEVLPLEVVKKKEKDSRLRLF